ncbi:SCO2522 family protein [Cryptosporangium sp. NPDC051539]|uniref:SCO2522 family protein n=1 Tax=Cryptosporangium sp. NPDC051539 TaxID=3363962 RepID=UPI0037BC7521
MSDVEVAFRESSGERRLAAVPLAHLSVQLGSFRAEDFARSDSEIEAVFQRIRPWMETARQSIAAVREGLRPRVSTCVVIGDGPGGPTFPDEVIRRLRDTAAGAGLSIDYLVSSARLVDADGVNLPQLVLAGLVPEPVPGTDGSRPPVTESGWLSNGARSPSGGIGQAMGPSAAWQPPSQTAARRHSVFMDAELWSEKDGHRVWSTAFLAAVSQLLRLGALRHSGNRVAVPVPWEPEETGAAWDGLPAIIQLDPGAAPFAAYRTLSFLAPRQLQDAHAVRVILEQVATDDDVEHGIRMRSESERLPIPAQIVDRVSYVFDGGTG